ncbi:serotonin transporter [Aplysia californica]|uniref:Transporter n=1 Tax=Aplysia californica TaxID=6500 RepID=Q962P1_APLCA|nr:serotonin transporter [Aplysia californica]AAK94482.3 serotonin transporter [Aplysia californica]
MTPGPELPLMDGTPTKLIDKPASKPEPERESWGKKIDFLLSVIGFAVDLGNVWRFPYVCYKNGGGAFLIPYLIMLIFGGLPLFYMELALGQFQRCGCFTVWKRLCPMLKGIGMAICIIATLVSWYYNTIVAWAVYFLFSSFTNSPPWLSCNNTWNTPNCTTFSDRILPYTEKCETEVLSYNHTMLNTTAMMNDTEAGVSIHLVNATQYKRAVCRLVKEVDTSGNFYATAASTEFFERNVLELQHADGISSVGGVKTTLALCLFGVFFIVYFALWKGIKSSGKAVWITATLPYVVLLILLCKGCTLPGAGDGIVYYLSPQWEKLLNLEIWIAAAAQIFFSLGPGFGVLLALSSYNKFHNNCYRDALITSATNCLTSFLAGFVVFTVLGYMAHVQHRTVETVARQDVGLIFVVYPEAVATLEGTSFWAVIFFFMLIMLGLDTTFGGLEAIITGILDEWTFLRRHRELFVAGLMLWCFLGGLVTTTYGGIYVIQLMDTYGAPISILLIVFLEAVAVSWIYGVDRFSHDIETMLGTAPGPFWRVSWTYISPLFLLVLFILSLMTSPPPQYGDYVYPYWSLAVGWLIVCITLVSIPIFIVISFFNSKGTFKERIYQMITPTEVPSHVPKRDAPVYL